jgi:glutamate-1-semialdehyde 2,1-aminomutase
MQNGYHGGHESFLVEGSPADPQPGSAGVPEVFAEQTIPVPFNDVDVVTDVFATRGEEIAAVLTEPILGNCGIAEPVDGFHETLRECCNEHGALLIFDEVITGFRVGGLSCAQGKFGIAPDLTTFAKVIGGGFPVGAIGGKAEYMRAFTPTGYVFESGTFNGHPVTMAAGLATLEYAAANDVYDHVNALGNRLRDGLQDIVADVDTRYTVTGTDSMFKLLFAGDDGHEHFPKTGADVRNGASDRWSRLLRPVMKEQGILLPPNQFESQFISLAHTERDIERTLEVYKHALT